MNNTQSSYKENVNELVEMVKIEQTAYHGEIPTSIDGVEYDGLGFSEESNVKHIHCSSCRDLCSEKQISIYKRKSRVKEDLCFDCHSHRTENLSTDEMATILMEELGWRDADAKWTFENQFKERSDLAYILMVASKGKYISE